MEAPEGRIITCQSVYVKVQRMQLLEINKACRDTTCKNGREDGLGFRTIVAQN